jgi:hypothetical protein
MGAAQPSMRTFQFPLKQSNAAKLQLNELFEKGQA